METTTNPSPVKNVNLHLDTDYECSFTWKDWIRLRDTWSAIASAQTLVQRHSSQLEDLVSKDCSYRHYASEVQNRQIRLGILERNTKTARELVRTARYRVNIVLAEIKQLRESSSTEEGQTASLEVEIYDQQQKDHELRLELRKLRNELVLRRRFMLQNLYETFFPRIKNCSRALVFKKQCLCLKFDVVRGLHLPTVAARLGHNDVELSAAAGFVVQLLVSISLILFVPPRHLLNFHGSRSSVVNVVTMECFNLYSSNSKINKARLDQAMNLLNSCVIQLRTHSGVASREIDRPIRLLQELLLSYIGNHQFSRSDLLVPIDKFSTNTSPVPSLVAYISVDQDKLADSSNLFNILIPLSV